MGSDGSLGLARSKREATFFAQREGTSTGSPALQASFRGLSVAGRFLLQCFCESAPKPGASSAWSEDIAHCRPHATHMYRSFLHAGVVIEFLVGLLFVAFLVTLITCAEVAHNHM